MAKTETLDYHFRRIWHNISRIYNAEASKYGLTMSVGFLLLSIEKNGTPSTQLGPRMGMEARSLTRTLKNLEEIGWIEKKNVDSDARVTRIFLTEEGLKKRKIARKAVLSFNEKVQGHFSPDEMAQFFSICYRIEDILDKNEIFTND